MKVRPTWTDAAGNGYYRGSDGKFYYGNVKNGYLRETIQERNARLAKERNVQIQKQKQAEARQAGNVSPQPSAGEKWGSLFGGIATILVGIAAFAATVALMGALMVIAAIGGVICVAIGIVIIWGRAYSIVPQIFSQFGVNPGTVLLVLPMLLSLVVFLVLLWKTFSRHKLYALHLLIAYAVLFLPYAVLQCGGLQTLAQGLATPGMVVYALLNTAGSCGIFPAVALCLFHMLDRKVMEKRQSETRMAAAKFCTRCGAPVNGQKGLYCERCGARLER